ncbi:DUF4974 domain-containing protein [uncultured Chitinophaga sp.]|jgi:hypothetical protein|uniref:DUF4974 domain-containing protein n=1 Tax=uncultured Chitinophaga sp. TaxID=339340 RepID=UPI00261645AE|nr:DUF4974 domain-containing protein [uncultured Chitinophaga sp.]
MLSLRKYVRRAKRVSNTAPAPFNIDEFIDLIVLKPAGKTTWKENRYIRRQVRTNPKAAQAWEDAKVTSPHEHFSLRVYHFPLAKMAAICLLATLIGVGIYAFTRYYRVRVSVQVENKQKQQTHFANKRLSEVAGMIEENYSRKVIFDREALKTTQLSGRMDPTMPLDEFLDELRYNNVETYIDKKGDIHIR